MTLTIWQVDAFADAPFAGNPAAVCLLEREPSADWMQAVAMEMHLSETAFLWPAGDGFGLRWFTPKVEVALCGHATLASAHVLWSENKADARLRFHTRQSGVLEAALLPDGRIELDFPCRPVAPADPPTGLLEALGVDHPLYVGRGLDDYLVEIQGEDLLGRLAPDMSRLAGVAARGIIVTCRSNGAPFHFLSRFFAPSVGVPEDPVTGSAHTSLGPYWKERLGLAELDAYQASARGGRLHLRVDDARVGIAGRAVTVLKGTLFCDPR